LKSDVAISRPRQISEYSAVPTWEPAALQKSKSHVMIGSRSYAPKYKQIEVVKRSSFSRVVDHQFTTQFGCIAMEEGWVFFIPNLVPQIKYQLCNYANDQ